MKKDSLVSVLLFILFIAVYLLTGYGTVAPYRDSGDLAAAAYTLGISHPPGYVLYALLGKVVSILHVWGDAAYRINFLSVVAGAGAVFFLYHLIRHFCSSFSSLIGAVCFGCIPALWRLSQVTEMYSINVCFAAGMLLWFLKERNACRAVSLGCLLAGLGLTNHQTLLFFLPGYAVILWKRFPELQTYPGNMRYLRYGTLFFFAGISIYLYLPLRSITEPVMDAGNPETLRNFWRMVSRSDYGLLKLHPEESMLSWTISDVIRQVIFFFQALIDQYTLFGFIAGVMGIGYAFRKKMLSPLIWLFMISGPCFIILANLPVRNATSLPILEPNLLLPSLVWGIWIGLGVHMVLMQGNMLRIIGYVGVLLLAVNAVTYSRGRGVYNRRNFLSYDYGKNIMRSLEPASILYNPDDPTAFITEYFKTVRKFRNDVRTIVYFRTLWGYERLKELYPSIMPGTASRSAQEFIRFFFKKNAGHVPIYADLPVKFPSEFSSIPRGLLYRLVTGKEDKSRRALLEKSLTRLSLYPFRPYERIHANDAFFSRQIVSYYTAAHNNTGIDLLDAGDPDAARQEYFRALRMNPRFREGWSNLGALEYRLARFEVAEQYFKKVISINETDPEGWYHLGLVLKQMKKAEEALDAFKHVPAQGRYGAYMLNEKGLIHLSEKKYSQAIRDFAEAIRIYPSYSLPYYNLGLAYQYKGDITAAVESFQRYGVLVSDPREKEEMERIIKALAGT